MSHDRPCTEPSKCRSCAAPIVWVHFLRSGKTMPCDAKPVPEGTLVINLNKTENRLTGEKFWNQKHDAARNRYTSHFATCPNAKQHRGGA